MNDRVITTAASNHVDSCTARHTRESRLYAGSRSTWVTPPRTLRDIDTARMRVLMVLVGALALAACSGNKKTLEDKKSPSVAAALQRCSTPLPPTAAEVASMTPCMQAFAACSAHCSSVIREHCQSGEAYWVAQPAVDLGPAPLASVAVGGGFFVTGTFLGEVRMGPGASDCLSTNHADYQDAFLARYDQHGALVWSRQISGPRHELSRVVAALPNGGAAISGWFSDNATFGAGAAHALSLSGEGLFLVAYDRDGEPQWGAQITGSSQTLVRAAAATADGQIVLTGQFQDDIKFTHTQRHRDMTLHAAAMDDIFLARYDASGMLLWAQRAGGDGEAEAGCGLAAGSGGATLITGSFADSGSFGSAALRLAAAGREDLFLASYDASGMPSWVKTKGGRGSDRGNAITALPNGDSLVTGFVGGVAAEPTYMQGVPVALAGPATLYTARHAANGALLWSHEAREAGTSEGTHIAAAKDGSALVMGELSGLLSLPLTPSGDLTVKAHGDKDVFITKYDTSGTVRWLTRLGGTRRDRGLALTALEDGSVWLAGVVGPDSSLGNDVDHHVTLRPGLVIAKLAP